MTMYAERISPDRPAEDTGVWKKLLSQGLSAHQLALAVAVGLTIGVLPTIWGSSLICVLISWRLGLNQLAVQTINYLVYPLQLALFVPFAIWGQPALPGLVRRHGTAALAEPAKRLEPTRQQPVAGARLRTGRLGHADARTPPRRLRPDLLALPGQGTPPSRIGSIRS